MLLLPNHFIANICLNVYIKLYELQRTFIIIYYLLNYYYLLFTKNSIALVHTVNLKFYNISLIISHECVSVQFNSLIFGNEIRKTEKQNLKQLTLQTYLPKMSVCFDFI